MFEIEGIKIYEDDLLDEHKVSTLCHLISAKRLCQKNSELISQLADINLTISPLNNDTIPQLPTDPRTDFK